MDRVKQKLNQLRYREKDWDESTLKIFKEWEQRLNELEIDKNYLELHQSQNIYKDLQDKLKNIGELLLTKREMTISERDRLFNLKEIVEMLLSHYSLEENLKQISSIEKEIDSNL